MPYGCMHTVFHQELIDSDKLSQYEKIYFTKILDSSANEVELTSALERLSKMLAVHRKVFSADLTIFYGI